MAQKVVYSLGADAKQLASTLDSLKAKAVELEKSISSVAAAFKAVNSASGGKRELTDAEKEIKARRIALNLKKVEIAEQKLAQRVQREAAKEAARATNEQIKHNERLRASIQRIRQETERLRNLNRQRAVLGGVTANQAFNNLFGGISGAATVASAIQARNAPQSFTELTKKQQKSIDSYLKSQQAAASRRDKALADMSSRNALPSVQLTLAQQKSIDRHFRKLEQARQIGPAAMIGDDAGLPKNQRNLPPSATGTMTRRQFLSQRVTGGKVDFGNFFGQVADVAKLQSEEAENQIKRETKALAEQRAELKRLNAERRELQKINSNIEEFRKKAAITRSQAITGGPVNFGNFFGSVASGIRKQEAIDAREFKKAAAKEERNRLRRIKAERDEIDSMGRNLLGRALGPASRIFDIVSALALFNVVRGITASFGQARDFIMETNQGIENARVGIASTITVAGRYVDVFGEAVPLAQQVALALGEADELIPELLKVSRLRGLSFDALLQTQTATAGFTKAAGFTPEQTVETIASVAFFSEKLGISQGRIVRTLDNIIKGYRVQQTELGTSLGLNDKIIEQWREKGVLAQELLKLLAGTAEASKKNLDTFDGVKNSINAVLVELNQQTTAGLFNSIKESYELVLDTLNKLRESPEALAPIAGLFDEIGTDIKSATESILGLTDNSGVLNLAESYRDVRQVLSDVFEVGSMGWLLSTVLSRGAGPTGVIGLAFDSLPPMTSAGRQGRRTDSRGRVISTGPGILARPRMEFNQEDIDAFVKTQMKFLDDPFSAVDAANNFIVLGVQFAPTALGGEDDTEAKKAAKAAATARKAREREALSAARADMRSFINETKSNFLNVAQFSENAVKNEVIGLETARQATALAESELSILEAKDATVSDVLAKQEQVNALKLAEIDAERAILNARIEALRIQQERNALLDPSKLPGIRNDIAQTQRELNQLENDKLVLLNEQAAASERQLRIRSEEAETLSDMLKGLRDGAKLGDVLLGIGQRASDNLIDEIVSGLVDGKGGGGANALLGPGGTGATAAMLPTWLQGSGSAPPPGLTGQPAPGTPQTGLGASLTSGLSSIAGGVGGFLSGPSFALGATAANIAGAFGAKQDEQLAIGAGGAIGAAVGSIVPVVGTIIGAVIGSVAGKLFNDAFINPPVPKEIQRRENITEAFKLSQTFPSLALAKNENDSVFPEQGSVVGRKPDGVSQLRSDLVPLLKDFDSLFGLLNLELDPENRGVLPSRAEKLGLSPEFAIRELRQVAQESTDLENGIFNLTNQYLRFAQEGKGAEMTQAQYNDRLASTIKLLTDLPVSFNYAAIAGASLMDFGQQQVADFEKLNEIIEDVSETIETSIPNAVRALADGGNLRDAISSFSSAFSETTIDRFTEDFAKSALVSGKFAEATILGNEASDLFAAGDTQGAYAKILQAKGLIAQGEAEMAPTFAELAPILQLINSPTTGGGGVQLPMFMQPNAGMDPIQRNNELLEENNYLLRNGGGQSGSVATVTNNTSVSISSREISDAERNAYQRQSSGARRPNPNVGVSQ